jgi:hypothetical protein
MTKKKTAVRDAVKIAKLETELTAERLRRSALETAAEVRTAAAAIATAPTPPAPVDPALAHYKALKASDAPQDKLLAGVLLRDNPHVLNLLETERKAGT